MGRGGGVVWALFSRDRYGVEGSNQTILTPLSQNFKAW